MKTLITTILLILAVSQADAYWEQLNKPSQGIISIQCFEEHNGVLFAGASQNRVYKFDEETDTWMLTNKGLPLHTPKIDNLYSFNNVLFAMSNLGVFASTDDGKSWVERNNGLKTLFIREMSAIGDILIAGGAGNPTGNIYISRDLGENWELTENKGVPPVTSILSLAVSDDRIYIGTFSGLYYSTDLGVTWTVRNFGNEKSSKVVRSLAIENNTIYIGTEDALWIAIGGGVALKQTPVGGASENAKYIQSISVSGDDVIVITYGEGVYYSNHGGFAWYEVNSGLPSNMFSSSIIVEGKTFVAPMSLGIYQSTDYGTNWDVMNNGFSDFPVRDVLLNDNDIYVTTAIQGVAHTSNAGETWNFVIEGLQNLSMYRIILCNSKIYVSEGRSKNVYYKELNDNNWQIIPSGNVDDFDLSQIICFKNVVFAKGNMGIYKLNENQREWEIFIDNGKWNQIVQDTTGMYIYTKWLQCTGDYLIAGTNRGIMVYDNTDGTWRDFSIDLRYFDVRYFSKSGEHIYVLYDKVSETGNLEKADQIMILDINQNSWQELDVNFDLPVRTIHVINGYLFVSLSNFYGIAYTSDLGKTWADVSLPANIWLSSRFEYDNEYIYIGTNDGVWRGKLIDFGIEVSVAENEIEQMNYLFTYPPYPVPARSEVQTKIYFDSSTDIAVENIAVYDIYGRKLPTKESLRFEQDTFYSGNIIWDCSAVEPGVYIIRINHGTEVRAVKVMVGM